MDDLSDHSIHDVDNDDLDNENFDRTFRVFSPFPQLDGNEDLPGEEISPKRYIFF